LAARLVEWAAAQRCSPPFATRRSSDLVDEQPDLGVVGQARRFRAGKAEGSVVVRSREGFQTVVVGQVFDHPPCGSGGPGVGRRQDRKSTRLNSSHVSISYAVFCLQKKN